MRSFLICLFMALISFNNYALFGMGKKEHKKKEVSANKIILEDEKNTINVFENNVRSVVNISNIQTISSSYGFFFHMDFEERKVPAGEGSGFVWDEKGHIVTNYHVVANGDEFLVTFHKDKKKYKAEVVGSYPQKDIAVLKLKEMPKKLFPVTLTNSNSLRVGQKALAIGSPFGLDNTITKGIVSAKDRSIRGVADVKISGMIQTDCSINPGNSGGPLYNSEGNLIGMNTMIFSNSGSSAGVGFAVPSNAINDVVPQLIAYGKVKRPGLGIVPLAEYYKSRFGLEDGLIIESVLDNMGAEKSGLKGMKRGRRGYRLGDVILTVEDKKVNSLSDIFNALEQHKIGDEVKVTYMRAKNCYDTDFYEEDIDNLIGSKRYRKIGCIKEAKIKLMELPAK